MAMSLTKPLEEIIRELPPQARHEVEDFAAFLLERQFQSKQEKADGQRCDFDHLLGLALKGPRRPPKIPQSWPLENPPSDRLIAIA